MPGKYDPPKEHQFQPGQSGNPAGKPKGSINMTTLLRELLAGGELEEARLILAALLGKAKDGDVPAIKLVIDRIDGLLTQTVNNVVQDDKILDTVAESVGEMFGEDRVGEFMGLLKSKRGVGN